MARAAKRIIFGNSNPSAQAPRTTFSSRAGLLYLSTCYLRINLLPLTIK